MTTDVFCRIVAGDAPAFEVMRTGTLVAFLDTRPLFPGHTLLVPTVHVQTYAELPAVPHLHLHVIPRSKGDGLRFWLGPRRPYRTDAEAQATADGIRRVLSGLS